MRAKKKKQDKFTPEYLEYMQSEKWQKRRNSLLRQINYCEVCYRTPKRGTIQIHHLTYKNLFNEPAEDLLVTCRACHVVIEELKEGAIIRSGRDWTAKERFLHTTETARKHVADKHPGIIRDRQLIRHYWGGNYGKLLDIHPDD